MERVICFFPHREGVELLRCIGKYTWIEYLPKYLTELFCDNYEASLEVVKYVPKLYFSLNEELRYNKVIIENTIKGFKRHKKLKLLCKKQIPLKLKNTAFKM